MELSLHGTERDAHVHCNVLRGVILDLTKEKDHPRTRGQAGDRALEIDIRGRRGALNSTYEIIMVADRDEAPIVAPNSPDVPESATHGDPVDPGSWGTFVPKHGPIRPRLNERLLQNVLGGGGVSRHPESQHVDPAVLGAV